MAEAKKMERSISAIPATRTIRWFRSRAVDSTRVQCSTPGRLSTSNRCGTRSRRRRAYKMSAPCTTRPSPPIQMPRARIECYCWGVRKVLVVIRNRSSESKTKYLLHSPQWKCQSSNSEKKTSKPHLLNKTLENWFLIAETRRKLVEKWRTEHCVTKRWYRVGIA